MRIRVIAVHKIKYNIGVHVQAASDELMNVWMNGTSCEFMCKY